MSKKIPYLVRKGNRFYFRMRVPLPLVSAIGSVEINVALGNISQAQAAIQASELAARYSAEFLTELHRLGLAANAPVAAPTRQRVATVEEAVHVARASGRELLAADEEVRIEGLHTEGADYWLGVLSDLDEAVSSNLAEGRVAAIRQRVNADLAAHGLRAPEGRMEARRLIRAMAMEYSQALQGILGRTRGDPVATPAREPLPASLRSPEASLGADKKSPRAS